MKKLLLAFLLLISGVVIGQSVTEVIYPRYIQGVGTGNFADDKRVPYVCRMSLTGLTPGATYRFFNRFVASPVITGDEAIDNGQGNIILANTSGPFTRITGPNLGSTINSGSFTTNGSGSYTGWFITDPRESQAVFFPGNQIYWRIMLNDGAGGTQVALRLTATNSVTVLKWEFWDPYVGTPPPAGFEGAAITNVTNAVYIPKNLVFLYDNTGATGRPISGTYIESDGLLNDVDFNSYADFYDPVAGGTVDGVNGNWGTIIPAILPTGIKNIRQYSLTSGGAVSECTDADGDWGGTDGNTVDPASRGYFDPVDIVCTPVSLPVSLVSFTASVISNSKAFLQWQTSSEISFSHFIVEKSKDGNHFSGIGRKDAIGDNSTYSIEDILIAGITYYRLKMVDIDGKFKYSRVVIVNSDLSATNLSAFPNPAQNNLTVIHPKAGNGAYLMVTGMNGASIVIQNVQRDAVQTTVDLSRLPADNYILIFYSKGEKQNVKFSKQ